MSRGIRILYGNSDVHPFLAEEARAYVGEMAKRGIVIDLDICGYLEVQDKLKANPNYDFVVIHNSAYRDSFAEAERCRRLSENSIIVAESTIYPEDETRVLQHFDDHIRP